jgi:hypothetical protein
MPVSQDLPCDEGRVRCPSGNDDWLLGVAPPRVPRSGTLEFVHFGLSAKYQLTTALARLRERGDREAVGEGLILDEENNPSPGRLDTDSLRACTGRV